MDKTFGMRQLENAHDGRDIRDILGGAYVEGGNLNRAAGILHRSRQTLDYWVKHLGGYEEVNGVHRALVFPGYDRFGAIAPEEAVS